MDDARPDLRFFPDTAGWLAAAQHVFARRIADLIAERTRAGAEIGLGYVPSAEAERLAQSLAAPATPDGVEGPLDPLPTAALDDLPIGRLLTLAALPPGFAGWAALMLLGETDARWGTLFAWLNDHAGARLPTAGLLAELAGDPGLPLAELLAPDGPLCALALICDQDGDRPLPDRPLQWQPQVVRWLLGDAPRPGPTRRWRAFA
ncbi:hypothetical protein RGUI_3674 [Rhodovulum sp. P5]|uniref:hypothetical protein n=1 Tax=Rhodovulum sp. P5 TaxID=1564506 RepID=UPI0009C2DCB8|nr:hypothetical protein [Rhodovulum sp. P5]ARE41815.1 hypothetical protein RGUI_3674 [Rhodovulum sp. P5]